MTEKKSPVQLVLIDGNAVLHRAYHALPPLTTRSGQFVNAVYGFTSMLIRVVKELSPDYLIVCFDRPKPTFRQSIYVAYQHKRPKMDEELSGQIKTVHKLVASMGLPIYEKDGYEADDVIGTLAFQAARNTKILGYQDIKKKKKIEPKAPNIPISQYPNINIEVIIVTGDRDLLQLVNDKIKVYMMTKGISETEMYDEKSVEKKFGIKPPQIIDYKALIGDSSDNYPGVPGVGPKTAEELLRQFGSLDNIYKNLDKIKKEKTVKLLTEGKDSAYLSRQLATILTKVPVKPDWSRAKIINLASEKALKMMEELEFYSLIKRLTGNSTGDKTKEEKKITNNQLGLF